MVRMDPDLEKRIREQLDRDEIWRVMQRYGRGIDRLDFELARSCYWDDCIEDHGAFVGFPDEFVKWAHSCCTPRVSTQHAVLNHYCDLQGDDAYCETYYIYTDKGEQPPHLMSTGRYVDHFQKRNGEWRIANRVCIIEAQYALDDFPMPPGMPPHYTEEEPSQATRDRNDVSYHRPLVPRQPK
ncbi:MAG: nuclear transport factor 2 family protein [Novosphingobium sp.]|nr:nuclear transport factor 2 family protein [Novosphingobium sp.]